MKFIKFIFKDGSEWGLPASAVAAKRAAYYADIDHDAKYQEEFDFAMGDGHYAMTNWFFNNQNPEDFEGIYFEIKPPRKLSIVDKLNRRDEIEYYEVCND